MSFWAVWEGLGMLFIKNNAMFLLDYFLRLKAIKMTTTSAAAGSSPTRMTIELDSTWGCLVTLVRFGLDIGVNIGLTSDVGTFVADTVAVGSDCSTFMGESSHLLK